MCVWVCVYVYIIGGSRIQPVWDPTYPLLSTWLLSLSVWGCILLTPRQFLFTYFISCHFTYYGCRSWRSNSSLICAVRDLRVSTSLHTHNRTNSYICVQHTLYYLYALGGNHEDTTLSWCILSDNETDGCGGGGGLRLRLRLEWMLLVQEVGFC